MQRFTEQRDATSCDQLWQLQHPPIFTLGLNGRREHHLIRSEIKLQQVDRGGQITYHAPGQAILYPLIDLRRLQIGVRQLVEQLEQSVIALLSRYAVTARSRRDAPGVYVDGAKIAALGLRVRRGCSYHGLSLNVDLDLAPFGHINPCGYTGMAVTRLCDLGITLSTEAAAAATATELAERLQLTLQPQAALPTILTAPSSTA